MGRGLCPQTSFVERSVLAARLHRRQPRLRSERYEFGFCKPSSSLLAPRDPRMGRVWPPWPVAALGLLFAGTVVIFAEKSGSKTGLSIKVEQNRRNVTLLCTGGSKPFKWEKDGVLLEGHEGEELPLGSAMDDPRGFFSCQSGDKNASLQVFFRMCQNCIHLDVPTILGIVLASLVATLFLAVAVFYLAVEEPSLRSQASDKQNLLANEQLYQPLGERNNGQYSHVGVAKTRRR